MLRNKIADCHGDSNKLHALVNNLTAKNTENPMSPNKSNKELADEFSTYFEDKILTIREKFKDIPQFESEPVDVPKLCRFALMNEDEVELIAKHMKLKSCKLDSFLTEILKGMFPVVPPAITQIVNLSLSNSLFHGDWKTVTVRPLKKKLGLQLINSNYRAVSN